MKSIFLNLSKVKFSGKDKKRGIKIPTVLTPELAEIMGIHIGDGSLYFSGKPQRSPQFLYSCHINEEAHYKNILIPLLERVFNFRNFRIQIRGNEFRLMFNSLAISSFFHNVLGFPIGKKSHDVDIPKFILNSTNNEIVTSCIRGIVDTDFYLKFLNRKTKSAYPVLTATFASKNLVLTLQNQFKKLGINSSICNNFNFDKRTRKLYKGYTISISGHYNLKEFTSLIGFNNPKYHKILLSQPAPI